MDCRLFPEVRCFGLFPSNFLEVKRSLTRRISDLDTEAKALPGFFTRLLGTRYPDFRPCGIRYGDRCRNEPERIQKSKASLTRALPRCWTSIESPGFTVL